MSNRNDKQLVKNGLVPKVTVKKPVKISCSCSDSSSDNSTDSSSSTIPDNMSTDKMPDNKMSDSMSYDEMSSSEESIPMDHIVPEEVSVDSSPPDVIVPDNIKLSEEEKYSYSGVETSGESQDSESYSEIDHSSMAEQSWSASETLNQMTTSSTQVNSNVFQVFINEMIRDKCFTQNDVKDFIANMRLMSDLMNSASNDDERVAMLLNPKYYNAIHALLDKLDTINVMCVLGTGNKCDMINDPRKKEIIKKQVQTIGRLVDIYTPMFVRMTMLLEKIVADMSTEKACNLDPVYLETIKKIRTRVVGSVYMRRLANLPYAEQTAELRKMSNEGQNDKSSSQEVMVLSDDGSQTTYGEVKEGFDNDGSSTSTVTGWISGDYLMSFLIFLIIVVIVYMIYSKK
ncbi:hypothetical protein YASMINEVIRUS_1207 [Yasminevirus sp. GU-2018]|uniref:Uncharacterized protein n=1 Tax=Yasminevirus sp. GU-2018 TaxID=2420051 RepID=A0A5K0UBW5_9VIRU|nr:hypothetical protein YASMINEVIRUS_1207 [Yasminevirus sp. GU-2018]